jgi:hypothetical protein
VSGSTGKKLAASVAVLAAVGAFVSYGVFSSFSDTKSNSSTLTSATFGLTQTPSSFLSTLGDLIPGDTITKCIKVENAGEVPALVTASPNFDGGDLNALLKVAVETGTGLSATNGACTGFVSTGFIMGSGNAAGVAPASLTATSQTEWAAGDIRFYRITIMVPTTLSLTDANKAGAAGFDWTGVQKSGTAR